MVENPSAKLKKNPVMSQEAFDHLLSSLGADSEIAARVYLELRRALFTYFAVHGAMDAEQLVDETFDRVARRLSEGQTIFTESSANYFYGVARNVWRESLKKAGITIQLSDEPTSQLISATPYDLMMTEQDNRLAEKRLACLEKCLLGVSDADRELMLGYYCDGGGTKIETRKALAARLGISPDSLRHRIARLKPKLSSCIKRCLRSQTVL